jgi:hypothetical protein
MAIIEAGRGAIIKVARQQQDGHSADPSFYRLHHFIGPDTEQPTT